MTELEDALARARRVGKISEQFTGVSGSDAHFLAHLVVGHGMEPGGLLPPGTPDEWRDWHQREHATPDKKFTHRHGV